LDGTVISEAAAFDDVGAFSNYGDELRRVHVCGCCLLLLPPFASLLYSVLVLMLLLLLEGW